MATQLLEIVKNAKDVNLESVDFLTSSVNGDGILLAKTAGNIAVEWPSGATTTFAVTAGQFLRIWPKKILRATTTASVQVMTL